jgi:hypothetical protein
MTALTRLGGMLAALAAFAAHAQSPESLELAGRLFERCGLAVQLQSLSREFEQGVAQNRGKIPDELAAVLADAGKISYAVPALRTQIVPLFARKLKAADLKRVLAWLDGPVGRRVTLAEEGASGRMTQEVMQAYLEGEKAKPPGAKRVRLLADLAAALNAAEIGASFIEAMSLGIAVGMDAAQPEEKRIGVAGLRARLRAAMPPEKLRADMNAALPAMNGYTYREIGDADLAAYLKFNRSAVGKRYNQALTEALAEALVAASVRVGQLVQTAPEKKRI